MQLLSPVRRTLKLAHPQPAASIRPAEVGVPSDAAIAKRTPALIRTKTQVPRSYGDIQRRNRLENLCSDVRQKLLTLVMAPPGCGKTTLARQWADTVMRAGGKVAWYSIDAADNDASRFLLYLHQAIAQAGFGHWSAHATDDLALDISPSELSSALINWITETDEELFVVLDNYAWITDTSVHAQVSYLLANAPSNLHVVMLTSDLPPLPIGRLRARNQLLELNSGTIRFTKAETLELFQAHASMPIPQAFQEELYRFSHGWAAVVRIISLSLGDLRVMPSLAEGTMDHRIFEGIDQYLDDLFSDFPAELMDMMADTSIVEFLSRPLCLALSSCDNADTYFNQIRQQQILLPSDLAHGTYTYPAPVRRYLRKKLMRKGSGHIASLHIKAHRWYSENAQWDNAVNHALTAGDTEKAIDTVASHGLSVLKAGSYGTLIKWQQRMSGIDAQLPVRVWLSFAWARAVSDKPDTAHALLAQIDAQSQVSLSPAIEAESNAIRAVAFVLSDCIEQAAQAVSACDRQTLSDPWMKGIVSSVELYCRLHTGQWTEFFSGSSVLETPGEGAANNHALRLSILGLAALLRGQMALAERYCSEALNLAPSTITKDFFYFSAWPSGLLAAIYYEQNRLEELAVLLDSQLHAIGASGYLDCTLTAFVAAARTAATKGKQAEALGVLDKAEGIAVARRWPRLEAAVLLERIRLFLDDDRRDEAEGCQRRLAQLSVNSTGTDWSPVCSAEQMALIGQAHLDIHAGKAEKAITPLTELLEGFSKAGNELFAVRIGTLLSIAYAKSNHCSEAERLFQETMEKAERGGFVRSLVDQGPDSRALLTRFSQNLKSKGTSHRLLQHCELAAKASTPSKDDTTEGDATSIRKEHTVSLLTPKENEVLALIACGQSNKEIARSLNVAPETIKTHLKNIYIKLSVDKRIQAVAKAQALGLLARHSA